MNPFSNLEALLRDGHSFRYNSTTDGAQEVTISVDPVGKLVLTSGKLLAWDLLMVPDERYCFKKVLEPGRYPVYVSVAEFPGGDARVACAMLRISEEPTVRWEAAAVNEPDPEQAEERYSYGVDSGTGSFMSVEVAQVLAPLVWEDEGKKNMFEEFCDRVIAEMELNSCGLYGSASWADMLVDGGTGANVVTFSSGWGDGEYASFWGFDASGKLTSLVTDFAIFPEAEAA
jgi:hypothetical protein